MAAKGPIELAPIVVEKVARRYADQHRRVARVMTICAWLGAGAAVAFIPLGAFPSLMMALLTVGGPLYGRSRRRTFYRIAYRLAEVASSRADLEWTYHRGVIQAHDRDGPRPTLAFAAVVLQTDVDNALPIAKVLERRPEDA